MSDVLEELRAVGYPVASLSELRVSGLKYRDAIPVLLAAVSAENDVRQKEQLVRALSVPWAGLETLRLMISEFGVVPSSTGRPGFHLRWAIGNAIEVLWDDRVFDELAALALDAHYGGARQMVVLGMGKSRRAEAPDLLISLLDEPDVSGHAVQALAKIGDPRSRGALETMSSDRRAWVRKSAAKGLEKIARRQEPGLQ